MIFNNKNNKQRRTSSITHPPILKSPLKSLSEEHKQQPPEIIVTEISNHSSLNASKHSLDTRIPSLSSITNYGKTYLGGNVRKTNKYLLVVVKEVKVFL